MFVRVVVRNFLWNVHQSVLLWALTSLEESSDTVPKTPPTHTHTHTRTHHPNLNQNRLMILWFHSLVVIFRQTFAKLMYFIN